MNVEDVKIVSALIGKTISNVEYSDHGEREYEVLTLKFTDGSTLKITSWDYEGFCSGLKIRSEESE